MDPEKQMRIGALLALATLALPILASLIVGALTQLGVSEQTLAPAFLLLVPLMFIVFVLGVVLATLGFIRRGRGQDS